MNAPTAKRSTQRLTVALAAAFTLASSGIACAQDETASESGSAEQHGVPLCMALPRVAIADGTPIVSAFSELLREQVAAFVTGPLVEPRAMTSRLPVQVRAEAAKEGCRYLLNLMFTHHPQSRIGKRSAETALTVGSAAASLGALSEGASGALGAASTLGGLFGGGGDSGASGAGLYPVGKNDRVLLSYSLEPVGKPGAPRTGEFASKAVKDNEPVVDVMIEKTANAILETLTAEQESP